MKNTFLLSLIMLFSVFSYGQNLRDALRFSQRDYYSSARSTGVGMAYGAIGADFGAIAYNPASVAAYHTSEFNFGFSFNNNQAISKLKNSDGGEVEDEIKRKLRLENVGLIIYDKAMGELWSHSNFAFGFNRLANFDQEVTWKGLTKGSFTDRFLERANGRTLDGLDNFEGGLAYDVGAIYGPDEQLNYVSDYMKTPNNLLDKSQNISSRGGINEMVFAYGASMKEYLMFGLSFGIPFVNYTEERIYVEESIDANSVLKKLEFTEYLSTSGIGFNFNAGLIGKLNKMIRIGASVHSPTYFTLQDDYYTEMIFDYDEGDGLISNNDGSPDGNFKYKFKSPWRYNASLGLVFRIGANSNLFVDADMEYADYTTGRFNFTEYSSAFGDEENQKEQNGKIQDQLKSTMTFRTGAELAIEKYRIRMGFVSMESPFGRDDFSDNNPSYSFGLGFRERSYYIDLAYINQANSYGYTPYELIDEENEQFVEIDQLRSKLMLTVGWKF